MAQINFEHAAENSTVRTRNVEMSYDVDVTIPREDFPEEFKNQQRLVTAIVQKNHAEKFGASGIGFSVGIVSIENWGGDTVTVSAVVKN